MKKEKNNNKEKTLKSTIKNSKIFNKISIKNKKKAIITSLGAIALLLIIIGVTYSTFIYDFLGSKNVLQTGTVSIEFLEGTDVISLSNALPISDKQGKEQTNTFDFAVTTKAKGNVSLSYNLMIEKLTVDTGSTSLNDNQIKVYLTDYNENKVVGPTLISNLNNILYSKVNTHTKETSEIENKYKLRVWIDQNVDASEWENESYQYKFKIGVNTKTVANKCNEFSIVSAGDTSGANAPKLSENMIPVYYDTCENVWKKADVSNKSDKYGWYDYDKQVWANSVTVKENGYNENINSNKTVNISDVIQPVTIFTSNNKEIDSSTSESNIAIKTGDSTGKISLEYSVSSESNWDKYTLTINDEVIADEISGEITEVYEIDAKANTTYNIIVSYTKDSSGYDLEDEAKLVILNKPNGTEVTISSESDYPWKTNEDNRILNIIATSYSINQETGKFELNNTGHDYISNSAINKYICSDITSRVCTNMYKITSVSNNITAVDEYTSSIAAKRSIYKSASPGTTISMDDILTMQVWIPRYKYKVWNYNLENATEIGPHPIEITFENGTETTGEITCTDSLSGISDSVSEICKLKSNNTECTDATCNNKTYTHPAFTFGDKELTGIWVGKFEVSPDKNCDPNEGYGGPGEGCNKTTIKPQVKPNVIAWRGAMVGTFENNIMTMNDDNNTYGFASTDDTHMIKNMEWGAVAYLSHSKYGVNKEVMPNAYQSACIDEYSEISTYSVPPPECPREKFKTGCGPNPEDPEWATEVCYSYETTTGKTASTTGNIYGIYDMSGSADEYVMGNMVSPDGEQMLSGSYPQADDYSGYSGIVEYLYGNYYVYYEGIYNYPNEKYLTKYSYSDYEYGHSKLGDSMKEIRHRNGIYEGWYEQPMYMINNGKSWYIRGIRGIFGSYYQTGEGRDDISTRLVISQ